MAAKSTADFKSLWKQRKEQRTPASGSVVGVGGAKAASAAGEPSLRKPSLKKPSATATSNNSSSEIAPRSQPQPQPQAQAQLQQSLLLAGFYDEDLGPTPKPTEESNAKGKGSSSSSSSSSAVVVVVPVKTPTPTPTPTSSLELASGLPVGFFDDQRKDAKARDQTQELQRQMKSEMDRFQAELSQVVEAAQEHDQKSASEWYQAREMGECLEMARAHAWLEGVRVALESSQAKRKRADPSEIPPNPTTAKLTENAGSPAEGRGDDSEESEGEEGEANLLDTESWRMKSMLPTKQRR